MEEKLIEKCQKYIEIKNFEIKKKKRFKLQIHKNI